MGKRIKLAAVIIAAVGASMPLAQADQGQFYIAPGIQWLNFDNGTQFHNDTGFSLGLGYDFSSRISAEVNYFQLDGKGSRVTNEELDYWGIDVFYDLNKKIGALDTFITTGIGEYDLGNDDDIAINLGAGIRYQLNDKLTLRSTLRSYLPHVRDREDIDLGVDIALVYRLGGKSKPAPVPPREPATIPPVMDSDKDGVVDSRDNCANTPQSYAVDSSGCPIAIEEVTRVELKVNFDVDKSVVRSEYFSEIEDVADFMKQYPDLIVELEGHTDSDGDAQYNLGLSQRRADAVEQVLIDRFGIASSRVSAQGFGESQPVATNSTAAGKSQNRRVITVIIKTLQEYRPR
ncbi:MAG: hypothetical protein COC19_08540 [SAR86 cluster bacterium]|uniref:OmpA-like domain-containing protein n=1 Tax=SAR86 cluster bacterium TaxID=2030880 RepID=A0A2A4MEP4_9GAMM|nr:MAG: hypothetical protein COC19_08540 [SAR86 cluster bacterium]